MRFNLRRMFAAVALSAMAVVFARIVAGRYAVAGPAQPALPVVVPLICCITFSLTAIGVLSAGTRGGMAGFIVGLTLGLSIIPIVILLDLRFLGD